MNLAEQRELAWIGDAVLSLYARKWILTNEGKMNGRMLIQMTSNDFLATFGNPTAVEAQIGVVYEKDGLEAAFQWIETELLPRFQAQHRNRMKGGKKG